MTREKMKSKLFCCHKPLETSMPLPNVVGVTELEQDVESVLIHTYGVEQNSLSVIMDLRQYAI